MLTGGWLYFVLILLALWFALLCRTSWRLLRIPAQHREHPLRGRLTIAGIAFSAVAVGSLLSLHLSWISPTVSQHLGVAAIKILTLLLFWPTLAGLLLSIAGSGRIRFLGFATSLITGIWWFMLLMESAISMGVATVRHPARYLIPDRYVGWVEIKYGESNAPPLPITSGTLTCRIADSGLLRTSSSLEEGWAKDEYFYYSKEGSVRALKETGWGSGGVIWGGSNSTVEQYFYVGNEEQYHNAVSINESRPFNESKRDSVPP